VFKAGAAGRPKPRRARPGAGGCRARFIGRQCDLTTSSGTTFTDYVGGEHQSVSAARFWPACRARDESLKGKGPAVSAGRHAL